MSAPRRWKDTHDAPVGVRELLSAARPPRAIDASALERGAGRVAKIAAAPVAVGVTAALSTKLAAAAVIGLATVGAVVVAKDVLSTEHGPRASTSESRASEGAARASTAPTAATSPSALGTPASAAEPVEPAEAPAPATATIDGPVTHGAAPSVRTASLPFAPPPLAAPPRAPAAAAAVATVRVAPNGAAPEPPEPPAPAPVPASAAPVPASAAPSVMLAAEVALLEEARGALGRDPTRALAKVAEHRARHPSGVLGAERDLIELDALRRTGRTTEARARAEAWLAREPAGLHAPRVRAILGSLEAL